jgi:hypothetical protein
MQKSTNIHHHFHTLVVGLSIIAFVLSGISIASSVRTANSSNAIQSPKISPEVSNLANWIEFKSPLHGITLRIPAGWTAHDLPSDSVYPGVMIYSPQITLSKKTDKVVKSNTGRFVIHIRTTRPSNQKNNFFAENSTGFFAKCTKLSDITINQKSYDITSTAMNLSGFDADPYGGSPYYSSDLRDSIAIGSACETRAEASHLSIRPNIAVGPGLLMTVGAHFDMGDPDKSFNISSSIPFSAADLESTGVLNNLRSIVATIKSD